MSLARLATLGWLAWAVGSLAAWLLGSLPGWRGGVIGLPGWPAGLACLPPILDPIPMIEKKACKTNAFSMVLYLDLFGGCLGGWLAGWLGGVIGVPGLPAWPACPLVLAARI